MSLQYVLGIDHVVVMVKDLDALPSRLAECTPPSWDPATIDCVELLGILTARGT